MNPVAAGAIAAVACGAAGLLMPRAVALLPEPAPEEPPAPGAELTASEKRRLAEPPKERYDLMAARAGFGSLLAYFSLVGGALVGGFVGWSWILVMLLPLVPVCVTLAVIDLRTRLLPSVLVYGCLAGALAYGVVAWPLTGSSESLVRGLVGMAGAWVVFAVLWFVYPAGMGFGDVRLAALLGFVLAYVAWAAFVVGLYVPFLLFGLPGLLIALVRRDRAFLKTAYPFGPFLMVGALVGVVTAAVVL